MMTSSLIVDLCRPIFSFCLTVFLVVRYLPFIYRNYRQLRFPSLEILKDPLLRFLFSKAKQNLNHNPPTNIPFSQPNPNPKPQTTTQLNINFTSPNPPYVFFAKGTRCRMCSASNSFLLRQPSVAVAAPDSASR